MTTRPIHVLLIDDDEDEFIVMRDLLSEAKSTSYKLDWTGSTTDAKEKMLKRSHDVYLVDYRLGEVSGLELLKEAVNDGCRAPIILLTGYNDEDVDREAMNHGAADYLQKDELSCYLLERSIRYSVYRTQMQAQAISQDRMAAIGLLASSLAHEIGTPLGVIRGRAEYLAMQVGETSPIKNNVDIITSQIDRVSGLIRSLLNLARGDNSEKLAPISLNLVIDDVLALLAHELRKNRIELRNGLECKNPNYPGTISVVGQSEKLHQVFLNLIVNAIHAIRKSRIDGREPGHFIGISVVDRGAQFEITVEDSGCGIAPDQLGQLFRPFYTTKPIGEGTGLGLATSLWIVQSWGGSIEIESTEGIGSRFKVLLPRSS